jgi:hypothetical protein
VPSPTSYYRYRALCTAITRLGLFYIHEIPRLEAIAQRIRYEVFASSFDYVPVDRLALPSPRRFKFVPLHQYKPLWLLSVPITLGSWYFFGPFSKPPREEISVVTKYLSATQHLGLMIFFRNRA